ncbi:2296_t:CDS:2 [Diversispora eburnea]|uniref:RNA helicase n=1 Tax=Diversispora eburnea TaxID=1213867 RepID=A0A9N8ZMN2_9GLOM|nr:2296_t:CDS:2 [Diversispora eburnea]
MFNFKTFKRLPIGGYISKTLSNNCIARYNNNFNFLDQCKPFNGFTREIHSVESYSNFGNHKRFVQTLYERPLKIHGNGGNEVMIVSKKRTRTRESKFAKHSTKFAQTQLPKESPPESSNNEVFNINAEIKTVSSDKPLPDVIYNLEYIRSTYKVEEIKSKQENQSWIQHPKSFLSGILKDHVKENFGSLNNPIHRSTVKFEIKGINIEAHGDASTKKEAERLAFLNACYMIEAQGAIQDVITESKNVSRQKSSAESAKKFVTEYCSQFNFIPNFRIYAAGPESNKSWESVVEFPDQNLVGRGRGKSRKEAEDKAAELFKKNAEEYQSIHGTENLESIISEEQAKNFTQFYCKLRQLKKPRIELKSIGLNSEKQWVASIIVENEIIGKGKRSNKQEAQNIAYLSSAINLRKDSPRLWEKFQVRKGEKGTKERPTPVVNVEMSDETYHCLGRLISDVRDANMFNQEDNFMSSKKLKQNTQNKPNLNTSKSKEKFTTKQLDEKSKKLYDDFQKYLVSKSSQKIRNDRSQLPITHYSSMILDAVKNNPVTVIVGSTGCGKTTQLPQLIFEKAIMEHKGANCNIIVTQPRRIAAISVAQRVAQERAEKLGQTIGYNVRFDVVKPNPAGSILYCTTGIFLRRMQEVKSGRDSLEGISHIIVDEVHERDMETDFMLVILKQLLQERKKNNQPLVKLVLMSATIDTGIFSEYFGEFSPSGKCPIVEVPGKIFPVKQHFLDDIIKDLKKIYLPSDIPQLNQKETIKYVEREFKYVPEPELSESSESTAIEFTTSNDNNDIENKIDNSLIDIEKEDAEIPYSLIALVIAHIIRTTNDGAILVFLSGLDDINYVNRFLTTPPYPLGIDFTDETRFKLHILHSSLPSLSQQEVFDPLPNPTMRKIILATNIAETSITIKDVVYVIDSGKVKENRYDQSRRMTSLTTTWISTSNARQRSGRAGRVREGEYYSMMSRDRYENLKPYATPEIMRSDLQEICLHIKALRFSTSIGDVLSQAIQPPDPSSVQIALENLKSLQALDNDEELTPLGKILATLPMEPGFGKMVLLGAIFQCLDPVLTIAASMGTKSPFHSPPYAKAKADEIRFQWSQGMCSDHMTVLNAFIRWSEVQANEKYKDVTDFCMENFLSRIDMKTIDQIKVQLLNLLQRSGVVPSFYQKRGSTYDTHTLGPPEYNVNSNCVPLIRALICAGVYPNLSVKATKQALRTRQDPVTLIHPASVNSRKAVKLSSNLDSPIGTLYAFSEKVKATGSSIFLRGTTRVDPLSVILFGGAVETKRENDTLNLVVDDWIKFKGDEYALNLTVYLKNYLEQCLTQVFERLEVSHSNVRRGGKLAGQLRREDEMVKNRLVQGLAEVLESAEQDQLEIQRHQARENERFGRRPRKILRVV